MGASPGATVVQAGPGAAHRLGVLRTDGGVDDLVAAAAGTGDAFVVLLDPFIDQLAASVTSPAS